MRPASLFIDTPASGAEAPRGGAVVDSVEFDADGVAAEFAGGEDIVPKL